MANNKIGNEISAKLLLALKKSAPMTMQQISDASGVGVANTRRIMLELAQAQQVIQVGTEVGDTGQRNRDLWAPAGWSAPFDRSAVRPDLIGPIMSRIARRRVGETAISLSAELGAPKAEIEATMACLVLAGRLTSSRVGPLACYHMVHTSVVAAATLGAE